MERLQDTKVNNRIERVDFMKNKGKNLEKIYSIDYLIIDKENVIGASVKNIKTGEVRLLRDVEFSILKGKLINAYIRHTDGRIYGNSEKLKRIEANKIKLNNIRKKQHYLEIENAVDRHTELYLELVRVITGKLVLKGSILLNQLIPDKARGTKDLDISVVSDEVYNKVLKPELERIGQQAVRDGLGDGYKINDIKPNQSGHFKLWKVDKKTKAEETILGVDFSLSDYVDIMFSEYVINREIILGSSKEKIVADKLSAIITDRWRRRVKDFYDLYIIKQACWNLDYKLVVDMITNEKGEAWIKERFEKPFFSNSDIIELVRIWERFRLTDKHGNRHDKVVVNDILKAVGIIYGEVKFIIGKLPTT